MTLAPASALLIGFGQKLRAAGFAASSDQAMSFLEGTRVLGPDSLEDIRRAARAIYGPNPERRAAFDALFDAHFLGRQQVRITEDTDKEPAPESGAQDLVEDGEIADTPGQTASYARVQGLRTFDTLTPEASLRRLAREAPHVMPDRQVRRMQSGVRGRGIDRPGTFRRAIRQEGEVMQLVRKTRRRKLRPILILIDISGSMKAHTKDALRVAHQMMRLPARVEVFSMGTELTRLTRPLRARGALGALAQVAKTARDFDGGTRLGESLDTLLRRPQWAALARGAVVITLSDGLEIGRPERLTQTAERMSRLAFAHIWLTPLAFNRTFEPQTEALRAIAPFVDEFGSARSIQTICAHVLGQDYQKEVPT